MVNQQCQLRKSNVSLADLQDWTRAIILIIESLSSCDQISSFATHGAEDVGSGNDDEGVGKTQMSPHPKIRTLIEEI